MEPLHQCKPRFDRTLIHQGCRKIRCKLACSGTCDRAIHLGQQRTCPSAAICRAGDFKTVACRLIDQQIMLHLAPHRGFEEGHLPLPDMFQIGEKSARRCQFGAGTGKVGRAVSLQSFFAGHAVKIRLGSFNGVMKAGKAFGDDHLAWPQSRQFSLDRRCRNAGHFEIAGRDIGCGQADFAAHLCQCDEDVRCATIKQAVLGQRACCHKTDDVTRNQRL